MSNPLMDLLAAIGATPDQKPTEALSAAQMGRLAALRGVWAENISLGEGLVAAEYVVNGPDAAFAWHQFWTLEGVSNMETETEPEPEPPAPQPTPPTPDGDDPVTFKTGEATTGGTVLFGEKHEDD